MKPPGNEHPGDPPRRNDVGREKDPGGSDSSEPGAMHVCEICGAEMFESHCKIICPRCGYRRDCSDP